MTNAHVLYALDPTNLKNKVEVRVEFNTVEYWAKFRYETRGLNLYTAQEVLLNPTKIYVGLKRPFDQDGWCYIGKPAQWSFKECDVPFPKDRVYAVYLNSRRTLFDHYHEEADPRDHLSMEGWENRFEDVIHVRS